MYTLPVQMKAFFMFLITKNYSDISDNLKGSAFFD